MNNALQRSFTLLELLIVIAIIGILVGVTAPRFKQTVDNFELESFVKDIFYLCRYLQATASAEVKIYRLSIDKEKKEFSAAGKEKSSETEEEEFKPLAGRFGKVYQAPQNATVTSEPADKTEILFFPDGSIDNITLTFKNTHGREISLVIQGARGGIKIQ